MSKRAKPKEPKERVEWGTSTVDDPETVLVSASESLARASVAGWNSSLAVARGKLPKALVVRRTVTSWEEVTD